MSFNIPGNQGTLTTIGGIGGALGSLLSGLTQGREQKLTDEERRAQIATMKAQTAEKMADNFRGQIQSSPQLSTNPGYLKILQNAAKTYGFEVPMTPEGGLDVNAFAPKKNLMAELNDPEKVQKFQSLDPSGQKAYAQQFDTTGVPEGFIGQQHLAATSSDLNAAMRAVTQGILALGTGKATVDQLDALTRTYAPILKAANIDVDSIINEDPAVLGKLTADTVAKLESLKDRKLLSRTQVAELEAKIQNAHSLDALRKIHGEHFKTMDATAWGRLQEEINRDNMRHSEAQQRMGLAAQRIQQGTGGVNGTMNDIKELRAYVGQLNTRLQGYWRRAKAITDSGEDVPEKLQTDIDDLQHQVDTYSGMLNDQESYLHAARDKDLAAHGATGVKPVAPNPTMKHTQAPSAAAPAAKTIVEERIVNGKKWAKYSDGTYAQVP